MQHVEPTPAQVENPLLLKNQLCFPLYACSRRIIARYTPLLKELGLTYTQYICLLVLWEEDGQKVGTIADRLLLDTGTLTPLLKKMEKEGLIRRKRDPQDERSVLIRLTEAGKALEQQAARIPSAVSSCMTDVLTDEEKVQLYTLLYKLLENA